jgi:hypothetical protein
MSGTAASTRLFIYNRLTPLKFSRAKILRSRGDFVKPRREDGQTRGVKIHSRDERLTFSNLR